ncbi:hypothetical protein [Furfurilactobacillus entadae]|uniref:hypothetical protein n=1 Tax=Furfurilactobacillus entadae TaxID=2922307 RepID=UPI0035EA0DC6
MPLSDAQKLAQKKYNDTHKDRRRYLSYRNTAKTFLRNYATDSDLDELASLVADRRQINKQLSALALIEELISDPSFESKTHAAVTVWQKPADLLSHHLTLPNADPVHVTTWFTQTVATKFDENLPLVEIVFNNQTLVYDAFSARDIVEWLSKTAN